MATCVCISHFPRQCYRPVPPITSFVINIRQNSNNNFPYCVIFVIARSTMEAFHLIVLEKLPREIL